MDSLLDYWNFEATADDPIMQQQARHKAKTVCLFGLSADPPTGDQGHIGIVRALQEKKAWESIWVLPVYRHTYKVCGRCNAGFSISHQLMMKEKQDRLVSFEHRLRMCKLAFEPLNEQREHHRNQTFADGNDEEKLMPTKVVVSDAERSSWEFAAKKLYVVV